MPARVACADGTQPTLPPQGRRRWLSSYWTGNPRPYSVSRNGLTPHQSPLLHKDLKRAHRIATPDQLQKIQGSDF
jgi:hypothetical protein